MQSRAIGKYFFEEDVFNDKVLNNLERVRQASLVLDENEYFNDILFQDLVKDPLFAQAVSFYFVDEFFNGKYNLQYRKFYERSCILSDDAMEQYNVDGFVMGTLHNKRVTQIGVPAGRTFNEIAVYLHEFSHYLNFTECPKMHYDNLLTEVHSIFIQHLFKDFCERNDVFMECGDLNYYYHCNSIMSYLYRPVYNFTDFIPKKGALNIDYTDYVEFIETLLYYYGYIYSNRLFEYYLDDEKKFLKRYLGIYSGQSLDEVLNYYNINMFDDKTIDATLKLIKRIK